MHTRAASVSERDRTRPIRAPAPSQSIPSWAPNTGTLKDFHQTEIPQYKIIFD